MSSFPNDPFLVYKRKGDKTDPFLQYYEPKTVSNGKVILTELPDKGNHVNVDDGTNTYVEITSQASLSSSNVYYVDYDRGIVYFDASKEGLKLNFKYLGIGGSYVPATRVYTQSANGTVTQDVQDMINNYNQLNGTDLYRLFDPQTGHKHTGASGDAPPIDSQYVNYSGNGVVSTSNVKDTLDSHAAQLADITINPLYPPNGLTPAKADGSDDTAALQNIINWINTNLPGATLIIPANKTFIVGTKDANGTFLYLPTGVNISGYGTIKIKDNVGDWRSVFEGSGTLSNQSIKNITIDSNNQNNAPSANPGGTVYTIRTEIYITAGDQLLIDNVTIKNGIGVWSINTDTCTNTKVRRCKLLNMGNWTNNYDTSAIYGIGDNCKILHNYIEAKGKSVTTAIERHGKNQFIDNNIIEGYQIGIIYATDTNATDQNVHIRDNVLTDVCGGVQLWANNAQITDVHILDNDIDINNLYFGAVGVGGIQTGTGSNKLIDGLTIKNNKIRFTQGTTYNSVNDPTQNLGIGLTTSAISNMDIEGNTIVNSAQTGITLDISGTLANTFIKDNKVINPGVSGGYWPMGIVLHNVGKFDQVFVKDNVVRDDRSTAIMQIGIASYSTVYSTDNAKNGLFVKDNKILNPTTEAYRFDSIPLIKGTVPNWTRGQGFSNGAVIGSEIYDSALDVFYEEVAGQTGTSWQATQYLSQDHQPTSTNFSATYGDMIVNTSYDQGSPGRWRNYGSWLPMEQQGYRTNAGSPSGVVTPYYIGEKLLDTTNSVWHTATGTANTNWN